MIPMTAEAQREERRSPERRRLDAVRRRAAAFDGAATTLVFDADGMAIEIVRAVRDGRGRTIGREAPAHLARLAPDAGSDEAEALAAMPDDIAFLLSLIDRAFARVRELTAAARPRGAAKDYAAEAAMKLSTRAFQAYLRADGPEAADAALKRRLGIASKRELNANADAAGRWRDLVRDFDAWMRGGGEEG